MTRLFGLMLTVAALLLVLPQVALTQAIDVTMVLERRIPADDPPSVAQVYQAVLDFEPGAWTPVHSHTGSSYNTVLAGEITLRMDGVDQSFTAGEGWVDAPDILHAAGNQSSADARLIATFVVRPGLSPSTIVAPEPGAVVPPAPTTAAFFKLNASELAQPFDVVHQFVNVGPGVALPLPTEPGLRIVSVLDGSVLTAQDGQLQENAAGDSWAEPDSASSSPTAGEAGAQIVMTTFVPRSVPVSRSDAQPVAGPVQLPGR
jgi:quercetin dioxygenase-like cupin family protein